MLTGDEFLAKVGKGAVDGEADRPTETADTSWPAGDGSIAAMLAEPPPPREWLVKNRLLMGRAAVLVSIGGTGKTTLEYHLAIAGVIGRLPWDWTIEKTGTSILFLTEDTADDVHHTLATMTADLDDDERDQLARKLRIFPLAGEEVRLLSLDGQALFENSRALGLLEKCQSFGDVVFIGIDPALALTEGDELNQAHQRYLGQWADRLAIKTGAAVLLTAHATKASANAEELTSHQSRGGGAITDAVRAEFVMRTMTTREAGKYGLDDDARKGYVQLIATKANKLGMDAFVPLWLRRGRGGMLLPADLTPTAAGNNGPRLMDLKIRDVLSELSKEATPTLAEWRSECERQHLVVGTSKGARNKSMERAIGRLIDGGLIERGVGNGIYLVRQADR